MGALATDRLSIAHRTTLDVTPDDVELALNDSAVVAGSLVGPPVFRLVSVAHASVILPTPADGADFLRLANPVRPSHDHLDTAIHNSICHGDVSVQRLCR